MRIIAVKLDHVRVGEVGSVQVGARVERTTSREVTRSVGR